uniref:uncharacterized protein isoform X2 n=1 Tax=Semicossyphus pulcher TaxID=241346 RepID=UPI0037E97FA2
MLQRQLCTIDHLVNSGFGRPFPRHGLQLLLWFAKDCVTCKLIKCVVIMKLASDCHPEKGCYGFHLFGNIEELLPVLDRPSKRKKQVAYYEVGNLNTETYPASEDLPTYVTQNYGFDGDYNTDRIIISYQARSRVVETVYVTQHDRASTGRFSREDTYEISPELIRALQSSQMDLISFLTQMGFYQDIPVVKWCEEQEIYDQDEEMFDIFDSYTGFSGRTEQSDAFGFFSETFNQKLFNNTKPFGYEKNDNRPVANYSEVQHDYRRPKASKTPRAVWQSYWSSGVERLFKGFDEEDKEREKRGGFSFVKVLLGAGALLLAVRCLGWLRSCWKGDESDVIKRIPMMRPSYRPTHVMMDYVY